MNEWAGFANRRLSIKKLKAAIPEVLASGFVIGVTP